MEEELKLDPGKPVSRGFEFQSLTEARESAVFQNESSR
jgi:hypothetical protein